MRIRGGVYDRENCRSRIAPAIRIDNYYYIQRLISTATAVRTAASVLTSLHVQGTYRDAYSSRYRLFRTNAAIRTRVGT